MKTASTGYSVPHQLMRLPVPKLQASTSIMTYGEYENPKDIPKASLYLRLTNCIAFIMITCAFSFMILDTIYYGGDRYPIIFGFGFPFTLKNLSNFV